MFNYLSNVKCRGVKLYYYENDASVVMLGLIILYTVVVRGTGTYFVVSTYWKLISLIIIWVIENIMDFLSYIG